MIDEHENCIASGVTVYLVPPQGFKGLTGASVQLGDQQKPLSSFHSPCDASPAAQSVHKLLLHPHEEAAPPTVTCLSITLLATLSSMLSTYHLS